MTDVGAVAAPVTGSTRDPDAELKHQARLLEGIFLAQLYRAMRATVPTDGAIESSAGLGLFTEMLDDKIAEAGVSRGESTLSRALYEQLRSRINSPASDHNNNLLQGD